MITKLSVTQQYLIADTTGNNAVAMQHGSTLLSWSGPIASGAITNGSNTLLYPTLVGEGMTRDRLILTRSAAGQGKIHVEGRAYYTNAARNVHLGGVSGEALAMGPFLHILDQGENDGCVLDLKYNLSSDTFRAVDNHRCGGFNVTFDGVWRRASHRSR